MAIYAPLPFRVVDMVMIVALIGHERHGSLPRGDNSGVLISTVPLPLTDEPTGRLDRASADGVVDRPNPAAC
jgi:hypothetical protein